MTLLGNGVAHVSFRGGGAFLPARQAQDQRTLIQHIADHVRADGLVQVLIDDQRWLVRALHESCRADCSKCGVTLDAACYPADKQQNAYCVTCVFAPDRAPHGARANRHGAQEEAPHS